MIAGVAVVAYFAYNQWQKNKSQTAGFIKEH